MSALSAPSGSPAFPFGDITTYRERGSTWLILPTASEGNRRLMLALSTSVEERQVAQMPSRDIHLRVNVVDIGDLGTLAARIIRRESYFRAILIQSRGIRLQGCPQKCGNPHASPKFRDCVRIAGFCGGACAECVWQSHGDRCAYHGQGTLTGDGGGRVRRSRPAGGSGGPSGSGTLHSPLLIE